MSKFRNSIFYIITIGIFSFVIYWLLTKGVQLEDGRNIVHEVSEKNLWVKFTESLNHNLMNPLALLLAQIVIILFVARIFGWISRKVGQPAVIGEIIAGIVLGPSLLGYYFPEFFSVVFPVSSLSNLSFLSQIGLIMFMFVIGMELDLNVLRTKAQDAIVISHASIIFPFALGIGFAYFIYESFSPQGVPFISFGLFMGIAMSITAFPVLARIVQEREIHKTKLGTIVLTCAAADDITAWCILATVIAIAQAGSFVSSLFVIGMAVVYVIIMIKIVRPFLRRVGELHTSPEKLSKPIVAIFFVTLILSAYVSEIIGIHALFGAFMAGTIMPNNVKFRSLFIEKVEDLSLIILLPLFFVITGLRTEIGLLNEPYLWKIASYVILVAVTGKFFGSSLAARFVGQSWKDSLMIGALMNTRGLMELVVLNIGYEMGILTPEIFAMMVIMALVTTFMTGPLLNLINYLFKRPQPESVVSATDSNVFKIIIPFTSAETGKTLLKLGTRIVKTGECNANLTAMMIAPATEVYPFNIEHYEKESLSPVYEEAEKLNIPVKTLFKISNDIGSDIAEEANTGEYNLMLITTAYSIFEGSLLGKMLGLTTKIIDPGKLLGTVTGKERLFNQYMFDEQTQVVISKSHIPLGVLIDKRLNKIERIFIQITAQADVMLLRYSTYFFNRNTNILISDPHRFLSANTDYQDYKDLGEKYPNQIQVVNDLVIDKNFLKQYDLMLISLNTWKTIIQKKASWFSFIPSALIVKE